ncbi:protein DD3-3-like [Argonauta hians]
MADDRCDHEGTLLTVNVDYFRKYLVNTELKIKKREHKPLKSPSDIQKKMLSKCTTSILLLFSIIISVKSDIFSHNPRGSNNRLNEVTANRKNANRLFDSQNNNKGGYNVGDATSKPAEATEQQYQMKYFQSASSLKSNTKNGNSILKLEWTNQHGCGTIDDNHPSKKQCNLVLQYMCQKMKTDDTRDQIRDGISIRSQPFRNRNMGPRNPTMYNTFKNIVKMDAGLHESWDWYDKCYQREQNRGLFTADQKLSVKNGFIRATSTRQNPKGARRGYECPEERDYHPYWHPTPWVDIAVFAHDQKNCPNYIKNSFNVRKYGECIEFYRDGSRKHASRWNNEKQCKLNNKIWVEFSSYLEKAPQYTTFEECNKAKTTDKVEYFWGVPWDAKNVTKKECLVAADRPLCMKAPFSRANHLGNGIEGVMNYFNWKLPYFPSGDEMRCVYRIRYNITTDDYDPFNTTSAQNKDEKKGIKSPVENDPLVQYGNLKLQLAINTAQFGRVFQDRSHVFHLMPRPQSVTENIYNLNVRGKRGNIVQVYPAVEYDFVPNVLVMNSNDLVHIQWTGSNTHNNKNDGNDGEGTAGTDRSNILQMKEGGLSYPLPFEHTTIWNNSKIVWIYHKQKEISAKDLAVNIASSGYYTCLQSSKCPKELVDGSVDKKTKMNNVLNNAPASYAGVLLRIKKGVYNYMCTRNNNFTNRSQKGVIIVK